MYIIKFFYLINLLLINIFDLFRIIELFQHNLYSTIILYIKYFIINNNKKFFNNYLNFYLLYFYY